MKIKKVKINNFKSVLEAEFSTPADLTAIVGGNESGKSNILKALIVFFADDPCLPSDKHQLSPNDPEIIVDFSLSDEEKNKIAELVGNKKLDSLIISKKGAEKIITNLELPESGTMNPPEVAAEVVTPLETVVEEKVEEKTSNPDDPNPTLEANEETNAEDKIEAKPVQPSKEEITKEILKMLPALVAVESVPDLIAGTDVKIEELKSAKDQTTGPLSTIYSFLSLGEINLDQLSNPDIPLNEKNKLLLAASAKAGKKIREYWTQEDLKIHVGTDGISLAIHVRDGGCLPDKPLIQQNMKQEDIEKANSNIEGREDDTKWIWTNFDERSIGFRWFVTFYSKYLSVVSESQNVIIVIDDLGIYLNASIQEVLYKKLLTLTQKEVQIIYTTHSPYILDFSDTENILLVEKREAGTKVLEDWWSRRSFRELPQPLRDIGVTRADHMFKNKNLLVEGATDVTVIRRLSQLFELNTETKNTLESSNIYPVGGKNEAIGVAMYCRADGKKAIILFDSDSDALKLNQRAQSFMIPSNDINSLAGTYDAVTFKVETIEDLIPDKLIVDALNIIGKELTGDRWTDIGNVHRKSGERVNGIMTSIKSRLEKLVEESQLTSENLKALMSAKKAILAEALENVKLEDYNEERRKASENVLTNLSSLIKNA